MRAGRSVRCFATCALALASSLALALFARSAAAYPTSIVFSPSGESLPAGNVSHGLFSSMALAPPLVSFGGVLGGVTAGLLPSVDFFQTPGGAFAFGGGEVGVDFGADSSGRSVVYFNAKLQLVRESKYWPATSIGIFQLSPQGETNSAMGYFVASKGFDIGSTYVGQLSFGLMRSFADDLVVAPRCLSNPNHKCLFRGSAPMEDRNGAILAGYFSPWLGPFGFGIDYVGGTSDVSSANFALFFRLWHDSVGGLALLGLGGFVGLDRRPSPPGPGSADGLFVQLYLSAKISKLFGFDSDKDWARRPTQIFDPRGTRSGRDDSQGAPPTPPPPPEKKPVMREVIIDDFEEVPLELPESKTPAAAPPKVDPPKKVLRGPPPKGWVPPPPPKPKWYPPRKVEVEDIEDVTPPKPEAPKTEAPKTEAPKTEAPKSETPPPGASPGAPPPEAPKTEAPKVEPPKSEAPKVDPPKTEAPKEEPPKKKLRGPPPKGWKPQPPRNVMPKAAPPKPKP